MLLISVYQLIDRSKPLLQNNTFHGLLRNLQFTSRSQLAIFVRCTVG